MPRGFYLVDQVLWQDRGVSAPEVGAVGFPLEESVGVPPFSVPPGGVSEDSPFSPVLYRPVNFIFELGQLPAAVGNHAPAVNDPT